MAGKRSKKMAGIKSRISAQQKSARRKNIAVARKSRKSSGFGSGKKLTAGDRKKLQAKAGGIIRRYTKKSPTMSLRGIAKRSKTYSNIAGALSRGKW